MKPVENTLLKKKKLIEKEQTELIHPQPQSFTVPLHTISLQRAQKISLVSVFYRNPLADMHLKLKENTFSARSVCRPPRLLILNSQRTNWKWMGKSNDSDATRASP